MKKECVCVLFGGPSPEHTVSLSSAAAIVAHLSAERYTVLAVYMSLSGELFLLPPNVSPEEVAPPPHSLDTWFVSGEKKEEKPPPFPPSLGSRLLLEKGGFREENGAVHRPDVVFPVMHGTFGEDGGVQGLLTYLSIPYVGCGIASSALSMDKLAAKRMLSPDIPTVPALEIAVSDSESADKAFSLLGKPLFVKPVAGGSSVGASIVRTREELSCAVALAARYGRVMAERYTPGRELEVAVMETDRGTIVSPPGEVIPGSSFYDYSDKYENGTAVTKTHAQLPPAVKSKVTALAAAAFRRLGCRGLARVDFFLTPDGDIYLNEINTMPGFTAISLYPRMMTAALGCSFEELLDRLLSFARKRR